MNILVTGAAGFIGFHLARKLVDEGHVVVGLDNLSDYYDPALKLARLEQLEPSSGFRFQKLDLADRDGLEALFIGSGFDIVVNLAGQAGVRYSLVNPHSYVRSNIEGFLNILECCRHHPVQHLLYASSSSIYGANTETPFSTRQNVDHPVSLYGASKKSNELFAHTYSHLFGIPTTGLRFFTVYGPWGRPDMAPSIFARAILAGEPIPVFNHGDMARDFTYVDDIIEAVVRLLFLPPRGGPAGSDEARDQPVSAAPYRIYNIGNNRPEPLMRFIAVLEQRLGRKAIKKLLPMQAGDVPVTCADIDDLRRAIDFAPETSLESGLERFARWYREYYRV